jgi:hypothetical protein
MPYKIYFREHPYASGKVVGYTDHISEARDLIKESASTMPEGSFLYIRQTPEFPVEGMHEPNLEAYIVRSGIPKLIWGDRKHRGMSKSIREAYDIVTPEEFNKLPYETKVKLLNLGVDPREWTD